jgi:hypothetical protein
VSVHASVRAALRQQVLTWTRLTDPEQQVAWEGWLLTPPPTTMWVREGFKPQSSRLQTLGPNGRIQHEGSLLLDLFLPVGAGVMVADDYAGELMQLFSPYTDLTYGGRTVTIRRVSRQGAIVDTRWVQVPLLVTWYTNEYNAN